jgi:hypothetical protein
MVNGREPGWADNLKASMWWRYSPSWMPVDPSGREPPSPFDSATMHHIRKGADGLREEFRGIFPVETIDRAIQESMKDLEGSRIQQFVPIFVHRLTRERLRALARSELAIAQNVPDDTEGTGGSRQSSASHEQSAQRDQARLRPPQGPGDQALGSMWPGWRTHKFGSQRSNRSVSKSRFA